MPPIERVTCWERLPPIREKPEYNSDNFTGTAASSSSCPCNFLWSGRTTRSRKFCKTEALHTMRHLPILRIAALPLSVANAANLSCQAGNRARVAITTAVNGCQQTAGFVTISHLSPNLPHGRLNSQTASASDQQNRLQTHTAWTACRHIHGCGWHRR